jgi:diaminopimelate decarboxylase
VTTIVDIKTSNGKKFLLTDGGINQQFRPAFMHINHPTLIINKRHKKPSDLVSIGGPCCTPFDLIAQRVWVPTPAVGDLVGILNSGAYGLSMSLLNFHSRPWPAEILSIRNKQYLIRKRGKNVDAIKGQIVPTALQ